MPFHVHYVFGPGGVGKTTLLREFAALCTAEGIPSVALDGRNVEPSPESFLAGLGLALGAPPGTPPAGGENLSLPAILLTLLAAAGLGALHALSPGHGKTLVAAYLIGSRGTAAHALLLGLTVTVTHTLGVYALGLITLFASAYVLPERLYPWLSLISGALVVTVGARLLLTRLRSAWSGAAGHGHDHHHGHHRQHGHDHDHDHSHETRHAESKPLGLGGLLALGVSGGLLPCPSALVLMLSAITLHRTAYGLALILAFSVGLAGVLIGIGLLLVVAGRAFAGVQGRIALPYGVPALLRATPALGALIVVAAGLAMTAETLAQLL